MATFSTRLYLLNALLAGAILATDLALPLGVAGGVPYVAVVMLSLWLPGSRPTLGFAAACSLLTALGYFVSPPGSILWVVLVNRLLAILAIWATALPVLHRKRAEHAVQQAHDELEARVRVRTAELREANTRLQRALDELKQFTYVASHDLKSPIRAIGTLGGWLERDCGERLDRHGRDHLRLLGQRVKRLNHLIDDILAWARVGRVKPTLERLDSGRIARAAVKHLAPRNGIHIILDEMLPEVFYDRTSLELLFQHLVGNAVQHLGKPRGEVVLACTDRGPAWEFSVRDDGVGIDPRHHERIFRLFQSLAPDDRADSTGIGLPIVKKIVEGHGGAVRVESEVGRGSTFFFTIPKHQEAVGGPGGRAAAPD